MKRILGSVTSVLLPASAFAADVPFTVSAPTFDWTVAAGVAGSMLLLAVGIVGYKKVRMMINRG